MTTDTNPNPFAGVAVIAPPANCATDKQVAFITRLMNERVHGEDGLDLAKITKRNASLLIERLMSAPRAAAAATPAGDTNSGETITDGFWVLLGTVYKVQRAVHGSGQLYAKVLDQDGKFQYASGAISMLRRSEAEKLTLERAKALGHLYGRCVCCGATLTDEVSIAAGIGPICGSRL